MSHFSFSRKKLYLDDLNSTLCNLGWDTERLEEGSLLRSHPGVLGGHHDVEGGEGAGLGGRLHLVGEQEVTDLGEILLREHEPDIVLDVRQQPEHTQL